MWNGIGNGRFYKDANGNFVNINNFDPNMQYFDAQSGQPVSSSEIQTNWNTTGFKDASGNLVDIATGATNPALTSTNIPTDLQQSYGQMSDYQSMLFDQLQDKPNSYNTQEAISQLESAGTYQPYSYTTPEYTPHDYSNINTDYLSMYNAPSEYEKYNFTTPEIEALQDVNPVAEGLYGGQRSLADKRIIKQYQDVEGQVKQAVASGQTRPEQAAALLKDIGIQKQQALTESAQNIGFEQANQGIGIAQQTQSLAATRGLEQANLSQQQQAAQASENAVKYGYDVDAAQYLADLGMKGSQAGFDVAQTQAEENQYGNQAQLEREMLTADEQEKAYISGVDQAYNKINLGQYGYESGQNEYYSRANALQSGAQGAGTNFATIGTYNQNQPESEQNKTYGQTYQSTYSPQNTSQQGTTKQSTYSPQNTSQQDTTKQSTTGTQTSGYNPVSRPQLAATSLKNMQRRTTAQQ